MDWFTPIDIYCERVSAAFWAEPLNAVSNLAFILAALWGWIEAKRRDRLDPDDHGSDPTCRYDRYRQLPVPYLCECLVQSGGRGPNLDLRPAVRIGRPCAVWRVFAPDASELG